MHEPSKFVGIFTSYPVNNNIFKLCLSGIDNPHEAWRSKSVAVEFSQDCWMGNIARIVGEKFRVTPESGPFEDLSINS